MTEHQKLLNLKIFSAASAVTLNRLALHCIERRFDAGQQILHRGDRHNSVMLLLSGQVKATIYSPQGREVAIRDIETGEVFGDYAAIDGQERSADIVALSDVRVATLPSRAFVETVTSDPNVAHAQMKELVHMIRTLAGRLYELASLRAADRIRAYLLRVAQPDADNTAIISPVPKHADLAARVSTQRHVVSTEFNQLEKMGLIAREKTRIVLCDVNKLQLLIEQGAATDAGSTPQAGTI